MVEIPKYDESKGGFRDQKPCWIPVVDTGGNNIKPLIVCNCGAVTGIGLHHVHADGTVTASYWHKRGDGQHEDPNGCEWHVFIKLMDYDKGEFLPQPK